MEMSSADNVAKWGSAGRLGTPPQQKPGSLRRRCHGGQQHDPAPVRCTAQSCPPNHPPPLPLSQLTSL